MIMTHSSRPLNNNNDDDNPFGADEQEGDDARPGYLRAMDEMIEAGKDGPWYT